MSSYNLANGPRDKDDDPEEGQGGTEGTKALDALCNR